MISSTVNLQIDITNVTAGDYPFVYGFSNSFGPYPLNQLFTNSSVTINNSNINSSTQNIISPLLRLNESAELQRYNSMCPSMPDCSYLNYADGVGSNNNVLAGYQNGSYDNRLTPRGAFPFESLEVVQTYNLPAPGNETVVATYRNTNNTVTPITTYFIDGVDTVPPAGFNALMAQTNAAIFTVKISSTFTE
jgi:hypothetical protein